MMTENGVCSSQNADVVGFNRIGMGSNNPMGI